MRDYFILSSKKIKGDFRTVCENFSLLFNFFFVQINYSSCNNLFKLPSLSIINSLQKSNCPSNKIFAGSFSG